MPPPKRRPVATAEIKFAERVRLIRQAGLDTPRQLGEYLPTDTAEIAPLPARIDAIAALLRDAYHLAHPTTMLFFVMYDIEHPRIRTHLARYLLRKGCHRVQKSIFLARLDRAQYEEIHQTLKSIQEAYDNHDSILLVPIGQDELRAMRLLGKTLDVELITGQRNVLFF